MDKNPQTLENLIYKFYLQNVQNVMVTSVINNIYKQYELGLITLMAQICFSTHERRHLVIVTRAVFVYELNLLQS